MDIKYSNDLFYENTKFNNLTVSNDIKGVYVADFETSKVNEVDNDVFVYATALMDVLESNDRCYHTNNIDDFINNIFNLPYIESEIYFHNLSFDVIFMIINLFEKGFKQVKNKYKERFDGGLTVVTSKKTKHIKVETVRPSKNDDEEYLKRPFSCEIIYNAGSFYRVDFYIDFETFKNSKGKKVTKLRKVSLLDSYKLVPQSLKNVAESFLEYDMPKDGIDHSIIRPKNYELKDREKEYLYEDVKVLKEFIKLARVEGIKVNDNYKLFFNKMTTAGQALNEYKTLLLDSFEAKSYEKVKALKESFKALEEHQKKLAEYGKTFVPNKDNVFTSVFPQLHPNVDCYLRQSYFGGITWKNTKLLKELEENNVPLKGLVYDVNSLYPYVMRTKLLPYGKPLYFDGGYKTLPSFIKEDYPLYIQKIRVKVFKIKKGKMPNIQIRESLQFKSTEYQEDNSYLCKRTNKVRYEECVFTFTNVQLERFLDTYDTPMGVDYIDGYCFKGSYGLFDDYIDTFMELKKVGTGARKSTAKLMLNSLYGKFGTNPCKEERFINIENGVFSTTNKNENDTVVEYLSNSVYLPMASFITAYAREVLLTSANNVFDRFLYCDTDSIHILGFEVPNIEVHDKNLGAWKLEGKFINAKYIGAKRYAEHLFYKAEKEYKNNALNNAKHFKLKWDIKCCGVSSDIVKKLDDIEVFDICEYSTKEVDKMLPTFYKKKDDIYYYKDKECSQKVRGLLRSKKKMNVKGGVLIKEQPYQITDNIFIFAR